MKVIDMHCDTILGLIEDENSCLRDNNFHIDLLKMKKSDYMLQCFAMFVHLKSVDNPFMYVNKMIDKYYLEIENNKDLIKAVYCYDDIIENAKAGLMSSLLTIEEGGVTLGSLENLRNLYRLGVRMITLTWNFENGVGYPNFSYIEGEKPNMFVPNIKDGLTEYGIKMIKEMERLGMIIDVSHLSDKGFYDVLENTTKPFVASHSNSRTVRGIVRNMTDDMIIKLANRGGVIGMNYCTSFISDKDTCYVKDIVLHIKYIKSIAGIDCIGLGSDFDGIGNNLEMNDASKLYMLSNQMKEEGFTNEEIEKVFYKNTLRLFKEILVKKF